MIIGTIVSIPYTNTIYHSFYFLFPFCCCVKLDPLPQIAVHGWNFPTPRNSSSEIEAPDYK